MYINDKEHNTYELGLTLNELRIILACVGDTFANLEETEFPSRIGASLEVVNKISNELYDLTVSKGIDI